MRKIEAEIQRDRADAVANLALASERSRRSQSLNSSGRGRTDDEAIQRVIHGPTGKFTTSATSPQQFVEDQYGGIIGEAYGMARGAFDAGVNLRRVYERKRKSYRRHRQSEYKRKRRAWRNAPPGIKGSPNQ